MYHTRKSVSLLAAFVVCLAFPRVLSAQESASQESSPAAGPTIADERTEPEHSYALEGPAIGTAEFGGADIERENIRTERRGEDLPVGLTRPGSRRGYGFLGLTIRASDVGINPSLLGGFQIGSVIFRAEIGIAAVAAGTSGTATSTRVNLAPRALSALNFQLGHRFEIGEHLLTPFVGVSLPTAVGDLADRETAVSMQVIDPSLWIDSHLGVRIGTAYVLGDAHLLLRARAGIDVLLPSSGGQDTELNLQGLVDVGYWFAPVFAAGIRAMGFVMPTVDSNAGQTALEPFLLVRLSPNGFVPSQVRLGFMFNIDEPWGPTFASSNSRYAINLSAEMWL